MERLAVVEAGITEGGFEVRRFRGDDGFPAAATFDPVFARTADGREFTFPLSVQRGHSEEGVPIWVAGYDPAKVLERVRERGSIDPALWIEVPPFDLRAELEAEVEREALEWGGYA